MGRVLLPHKVSLELGLLPHEHLLNLGPLPYKSYHSAAGLSCSVTSWPWTGFEEHLFAELFNLSLYQAHKQLRELIQQAVCFLHCWIYHLEHRKPLSTCLLHLCL